jgi:hypothetical protein
MEPFTLAELGLFIGTIGGCITTLIFALQKSRCETINCCGVHCKRKIKESSPEPEPEPEVNN